jgi:hypothetical protein
MKSSYTEKQLKTGIKVEREHSNNIYVQEKIAKDHLQENPNYYDYSNGNKKEYLVNETNKNKYCKK